MAITTIAENTTTTTGVEQTLATDTTGKLYVAKFDDTNLVRGRDYLTIRMKDIVRTGGTERLVYANTFPKGTPVIGMSTPLPADISCKLTMECNTSGLAVPWKLLSLGTPTNVREGTIVTDGSEQVPVIFSSVTFPHTYVFKIDLGAMANGDRVEVRIWDQVRSTSGGSIISSAIYAHAQASPIKHSLPVLADVNYAVSIIRRAGTDRSYPWKLLAIG